MHFKNVFHRKDSDVSAIFVQNMTLFAINVAAFVCNWPGPIELGSPGGLTLFESGNKSECFLRE